MDQLVELFSKTIVLPISEIKVNRCDKDDDDLFRFFLLFSDVNVVRLTPFHHANPLSPLTTHNAMAEKEILPRKAVHSLFFKLVCCKTLSRWNPCFCHFIDTKR